MANRLPAQEHVQATSRFTRVGDLCVAAVDYNGQLYAFRFWAADRDKALDAATWLVGEDGWSWYLAAVMCRTIRRGLIE